MKLNDLSETQIADERRKDIITQQRYTKSQNRCRDMTDTTGECISVKIDRSISRFRRQYECNGSWHLAKRAYSVVG